MEVLAGENNFQAEVSQYGTRFRLDFSKVGRSRGGGLLMLCGRETGGWGGAEGVEIVWKGRGDRKLLALHKCSIGHVLQPLLQQQQHQQCKDGWRRHAQLGR
jgi:hypothetical protein